MANQVRDTPDSSCLISEGCVASVPVSPSVGGVAFVLIRPSE